MIPIVAVAGTHGWRPGMKGQWWQDESAWWEMLRREGFGPALDRPFIWSTGLDGVLGWRKHATWVAAANSFSYYVQMLKGPLHVVCHSHGLQPVAMAAAWLGVEIATCTSIGSPLREDVPYGKALERIRFWQHVHSDSSDWWQVLGEACDGRFGLPRSVLLPTVVNHNIPGVGHTRVLEDATVFPSIWPQLLDAIRRIDAESRLNARA